MIIVLDTNVLISGIFWSGPPNKILKLWQLKKFKLAVSLEIMDEYRRISKELSRKNAEIDISAILDMILFNSDIHEIELPKKAICKDPDDDKFLICALAAQAEYLITGDKFLLELNGYNGIQIIKPKEFLERVG